VLRQICDIAWTGDRCHFGVGTLGALSRERAPLSAAQDPDYPQRRGLSLFTGAVNSDLKSRLGLHEHELVVGILAALRPEKDHETFLRAASLASERNPRARLRFTRLLTWKTRPLSSNISRSNHSPRLRPLSLSVRSISSLDRTRTHSPGWRPRGSVFGVLAVGPLATMSGSGMRPIRYAASITAKRNHHASKSWRRDLAGSEGTEVGAHRLVRYPVRGDQSLGGLATEARNAIVFVTR
jgi:hypothetical protein